jgi:hypothetical protein
MNSPSTFELRGVINGVTCLIMMLFRYADDGYNTPVVNAGKEVLQTQGY